MEAIEGSKWKWFAVVCTGITVLSIAGCSKPASSTDVYVILTHTVVRSEQPTQEDDYTVKYGSDVLKVKYARSQTSTWKPGDAPGTGLHDHSVYDNPDLSQVPQVGVPIRRCEMDYKNPMSDGSLAIAIQSTPAPCMVQIGDILEYEPSPNAGAFTFVAFDILSEKVER